MLIFNLAIVIIARFFLSQSNYSEVRPFHCQTLDVRHNWGEKERFWPHSTEFI